MGYLNSYLELEKTTRLERLNEAKRDLELPNISDERHIADAMITLGPTRSNGMGLVATDWDVIAPFAASTGAVSGPWELTTLAAMCDGYATAVKAGENPLAIPPVEQEERG